MMCEARRMRTVAIAGYEAEVKNYSLTDFDCIAEVAAQEGYIESSDIEKLIAFRNNPSDESWIGAQK